MRATAVYRTAEIRAAEQKACSAGIPESVLMERAGAAALETLNTCFPDAQSIAIFCGAGNNAGDGYVLARLLHERQVPVTVFALKAPEDLPDTARMAAFKALQRGVSVREFEEAEEMEVSVVVDALLGTGLRDAPSGLFAQAISLINNYARPVLALDIPSGLAADTGEALGEVVKATVTISFVALKLGLYLRDGIDCCGKIVSDCLEIAHCLDTSARAATLLEVSRLQKVLPARARNTHKGDYGHVLCIGGGIGMPGSIRMSAEAALRVGAGMVTIATLPRHVNACANLPEAMVHGVETAQDLQPLLARASVCVLGPGLGTDAWGRTLFQAAIASMLPTVVDASALTLLAEMPQHDDNWILTPHPGEAARLLGVSSTAVQDDRLEALTRLQQQFGGVIVLKGARTLVQTPSGDTSLCGAGNPGMASAGMGDVLSGIIGGLLAQGLTLADAATSGVMLHATVADRAARVAGERGMLARDVIAGLRAGVNGR